jgi:hypothetical protein
MTSGRHRRLCQEHPRKSHRLEARGAPPERPLGGVQGSSPQPRPGCAALLLGAVAVGYPSAGVEGRRATGTGGGANAQASAR